MTRTEGNSGVLVSDVVALLVGKEHVRGKTTLGGVGVCRVDVSAHAIRERSE
jgi:hypothetical protein